MSYHSCTRASVPGSKQNPLLQLHDSFESYCMQILNWRHLCKCWCTILESAYSLVNFTELPYKCKKIGHTNTNTNTNTKTSKNTMTNTKKRGNTNAPTNTYTGTEPCQ